MSRRTSSVWLYSERIGDGAHKDRDTNVAVGIDCEVHVLEKERWCGVDQNTLLGCHIGVMKRILGGKSGNSGGKVNRALKKPPSLNMDIRTKAST